MTKKHREVLEVSAHFKDLSIDYLSFIIDLLPGGGASVVFVDVGLYATRVAPLHPKGVGIA